MANTELAMVSEQRAKLEEENEDMQRKNTTLRRRLRRQQAHACTHIMHTHAHPRTHIHTHTHVPQSKVVLVEKNRKLRKELASLKEMNKVSDFKDRDTLVQMLENEKAAREFWENLSTELEDRVQELEAGAGPPWLRQMEGPTVDR